jgi:hypothetical protein
MSRYGFLNRRSQFPTSFQRASTEIKKSKNPKIPKSRVHPMHRGVNYHQGSKRYSMNAVYLDENYFFNQFKHQSMGSIIKKMLWRMN